MKVLLLGFALLPGLLFAQATHREATPEEKVAILGDGAEKKLKEVGVALSRQAETSAIEKSLVKEALDKGSLPSAQVKAYLQHLTNQDYTKEEIEIKINELSRGYFGELQLTSSKSILSEEKQKDFKEKFEQLDKKNASHEEFDKELSKLDAEISSSALTKENEKKVEAFMSSFHKELKNNSFIKTAPEINEENYTPLSVMVPLDFSIQEVKEDCPLCADQPQVTVSEQVEKLSSQVEEMTKKPKIQEIWFAWGYNRATHSDADAKFTTPHGTFTIHDAVGKDKPEPFTLRYFNPEKITIPQYNIELGVMFNEKWGMDFHADHMKWVFDRLRPYEISGNLDLIVAGANGRIPFETAKANKDATWLRFEHTDGYNYLSLGAIYNQNLVKTKKDRFAIDARFSAGAGLLVPRSDVRLYHGKEGHRYGINNKFHVAGGGVHADARLKFTFWDSIFLQAMTRATHIKVQNALVDGAGARLEHIQPITSFQVIGQIGYQYKFGDKKKKKKKK